MPIRLVRCHVLHANVSVITDLEDCITRIICSEYDAPTGTCRLKRQASEGGPLSQLLDRVSEDSLATRGTRCELSA